MTTRTEQDPETRAATGTSHLLLVRHGEPIDEGVCHGARSDPELSPLGTRQAEGLALRVRLLGTELGPLRRLVCSPSARAVATALPLRDLLDATTQRRVVDERWRERDWGEWEGRPWDELWSTAPEEVTSDPAAYLAWTPPGAEGPDEVADRIEPALAEALAGPGLTVVVTHAGAIRQALATALDLPLVTALQIEVPYGRITGLARTGDAATLTRVGA